MHRLLPLGIAVAFLGLWLGLIPVSADDTDCGSLYRPKTLSTDFGNDMPAEMRGLAGDAFGALNESCESQRQMILYPLVAIVVAGIGAAMVGGVAWRRQDAAVRAASRT